MRQMSAFRLALILTAFACCTRSFAEEKCLVRILNIVAHEDDDLLFLSPDLLKNVRSGSCVRTVYFTAGDGGFDDSYIARRVKGIESAYATMAGQGGDWSMKDASAGNRTISLATLPSAPKLSLVFLWLPDGGIAGDGFEQRGFQSLHKLRKGQIDALKSIRTDEAFSLPVLQDVVRDLVADYQPTELRIQDIEPTTPDHSDHRSVVAIVQSAVNFRGTQLARSYRDDIIFLEPENVTGDALQGKEAAFEAYAAHDSEIGDFHSIGNIYYHWLRRQYSHPVDLSHAGAP